MVRGTVSMLDKNENFLLGNCLFCSSRQMCFFILSLGTVPLVIVFSPPSEFLGQAWAKSEKDTKAAHIVLMTKRFNEVKFSIYKKYAFNSKEFTICWPATFFLTCRLSMLPIKTKTLQKIRDVTK